jgi:hypothetical protein
MLQYQHFNVPYTTADLVLDTGLASTEKEPKTLHSILVQVDGYNGAYVEGWIKQRKLVDIQDSLIDTTEVQAEFDSDGVPANAKSAMRINEIPVEIELGVGEIFQIGIRNVGGTVSLAGSYVFEVRT